MAILEKCSLMQQNKGLLARGSSNIFEQMIKLTTLQVSQQSALKAEH